MIRYEESPGYRVLRLTKLDAIKLAQDLMAGIGAWETRPAKAAAQTVCAMRTCMVDGRELKILFSIEEVERVRGLYD